MTAYFWMNLIMSMGLERTVHNILLINCLKGSSISQACQLIRFLIRADSRVYLDSSPTDNCQASSWWNSSLALPFDLITSMRTLRSPGGVRARWITWHHLRPWWRHIATRSPHTLQNALKRSEALTKISAVNRLSNLSAAGGHVWPISACPPPWCRSLGRHLASCRAAPVVIRWGWWEPGGVSSLPLSRNYHIVRNTWGPSPPPPPPRGMGGENSRVRLGCGQVLEIFQQRMRQHMQSYCMHNAIVWHFQQWCGFSLNPVVL